MQRNNQIYLHKERVLAKALDGLQEKGGESQASTFLSGGSLLEKGLEGLVLLEPVEESHGVRLVGAIYVVHAKVARHLEENVTNLHDDSGLSAPLEQFQELLVDPDQLLNVRKQPVDLLHRDGLLFRQLIFVDLKCRMRI